MPTRSNCENREREHNRGENRSGEIGEESGLQGETVEART